MASALEFPAKPDRFVNDFAGMMNANEQATLNATLGQFRDKSKVSIVFVTITSAQDYGASGLAELGVKLFDKWKPGAAGLDSGILVIIAGKAPPYKVRIVTGRGVEGAVPDLAAKTIIEQSMKPSMHSGKFAAGLSLGADALMERTKDEFVAKKISGAREAQNTNLIPAMLALAIALIGLLALIMFIYRQNTRAKEKRMAIKERQEQVRKKHNQTFSTWPPPLSRVPIPPSRRSQPRSNRDDVVAAAVVSTPPTSHWESRRSGDDSSSSSSWSSSSPDTGGSTAGGGAGDN